MNELCFATNLSSSDIASWAQASVSALAIVAGTGAIFWQVRRARLELAEREARAHDGLARLLVHVKDSARDARQQKLLAMHTFKALTSGDPPEHFKTLAAALEGYPLDSIQSELPLEVLLNARAISRQLWPLVAMQDDLDLDGDSDARFHGHIGALESQISSLRDEASRLLRGERARHAAAADPGAVR